MSDIAELMASNDPMATPVMSLGPAPPQNTSPPPGVGNTAAMHEKQIAQMSPLSQVLPDEAKAPRGKGSRLSPEQKAAVIVGICTFIVLLPNVQQLLTSQLPVLTSNGTLHVVTNSVLVAFLFFYMKEHISELL